LERKKEERSPKKTRSHHPGVEGNFSKNVKNLSLSQHKLNQSRKEGNIHITAKVTQEKKNSDLNKELSSLCRLAKGKKESEISLLRV